MANCHWRVKTPNCVVDVCRPITVISHHHQQQQQQQLTAASPSSAGPASSIFSHRSSTDVQTLNYTKSSLLQSSVAVTLELSTSKPDCSTRKCPVFVNYLIHGLFAGPSYRLGPCSTAHRSNRPDHWDAYVRQVSGWTTFILIH